MKIFKKFIAWEKKQMNNPETVLAVWIAVGLIVGVGMDNIGVGIAIGLSIGVAMSAAQRNKNKKKEDEIVVEEK
jgi:F0F1-type ATP synthase membrane subunit c/vacuolar-type H+-ATPase subunit K